MWKVSETVASTRNPPSRGKIDLKFNKESMAEGLRMSGTYPVYRPDFTNGPWHIHRSLLRLAKLYRSECAPEWAKEREQENGHARQVTHTSCTCNAGYGCTMNIFALLLGVRYKASSSLVRATRFFHFWKLFIAQGHAALAREDPSSSTSCALPPLVHRT